MRRRSFRGSTARASGGALAGGCEDVADHALALVRAAEELKADNPEDQKVALALAQELRARVVKECTTRAWDARLRRCVLDATTVEQTRKCDFSALRGDQPGGAASVGRRWPRAERRHPGAERRRRATGRRREDRLEPGVQGAAAGHGYRQAALPGQGEGPLHRLDHRRQMFDSSIPHGKPSTFRCAA